MSRGKTEKQIDRAIYKLAFPFALAWGLMLGLHYEHMRKPDVPTFGYLVSLAIVGGLYFIRKLWRLSK